MTNMLNENSYCTFREGLPRLRKKLELQAPVTVAYLGGSITEGYGASDPDRSSWRALAEQYLQTAYPSI